MPVTDRGWPEKAGVSPGVDVVRFLIRLQWEHTHPHAHTHRHYTHTDTAGRRLANVVFFLRGMRWAVGGGWGRRWHWLGKGVRVAGPLFYSLVITGGGVYWYVAGCGGNTHTCVRSHTHYTVRPTAFHNSSRRSANISLRNTSFNESNEMRFSIT